MNIKKLRKELQKIEPIYYFIDSNGERVGEFNATATIGFCFNNYCLKVPHDWRTQYRLYNILLERI